MLLCVRIRQSRPTFVFSILFYRNIRCQFVFRKIFKLIMLYLLNILTLQYMGHYVVRVLRAARRTHDRPTIITRRQHAWRMGRDVMGSGSIVGQLYTFSRFTILIVIVPSRHNCVEFAFVQSSKTLISDPPRRWCLRNNYDSLYFPPTLTH